MQYSELLVFCENDSGAMQDGAYAQNSNDRSISCFIDTRFIHI